MLYNLSYSCNCSGGLTLKKEIKQSKLIFSGKVIGVKPLSIDNHYEFSKGTHIEYEITFTVLKIYKGRRIEDTVIVITPSSDGQCGIDFEIGKEYIVFAVFEYLSLNKNKKKCFTTNTCFRTSVFNKQLESQILSIRKE